VSIREDNTEMDHTEIGSRCELDPSGFRQGPRWAVMNTISKLRVP
jgi:hypothetical protein